MIRHTTSFSLSLLLHLVLFVGMFFFFQSDPKTVQEEQTVRMQLHQFIEQHPKQSQETIQPLRQPQKNPAKQEPPKQKTVVKKTKTDIFADEVSVAPMPQEEESVSALEPVLQEYIETSSQNIQETPDMKSQPVVMQNSDDYLDKHLLEIASLLQEHLYYPRSARKRGLEGIVTVRFTLFVTGAIADIEVLESKHEILSRAAVQTIESLAGKFPKPERSLTLSVPIEYRLR